MYVFVSAHTHTHAALIHYVLPLYTHDRLRAGYFCLYTYGGLMTVSRMVDYCMSLSLELALCFSPFLQSLTTQVG